MLDIETAKRVLKYRTNPSGTSCSVVVRVIRKEQKKKPNPEKKLKTTYLPPYIALTDTLIPVLKKCNEIKSLSIKFHIPDVLPLALVPKELKTVMDRMEVVIGACLGSIANNFDLEELNVVVGRDKTKANDMHHHFRYLHGQNLNRKVHYAGWDKCRAELEDELDKYDQHMYESCCMGILVSDTVKMFSFNASSIIGIHFYFKSFHMPAAMLIATTSTVPCDNGETCRIAEFMRDCDLEDGQSVASDNSGPTQNWDSITSANPIIYPRCKMPCGLGLIDDQRKVIQGFGFQDPSGYTFEFVLQQLDNDYGVSYIGMDSLTGIIAPHAETQRNCIMVYCNADYMRKEIDYKSNYGHVAFLDEGGSDV